VLECNTKHCLAIHSTFSRSLCRRIVRILSFALLPLLLTACENFRVQNFAKSDTDLATDQHMVQIEGYLKELTIKLYKRNPRELKKAPSSQSIEDRLAILFPDIPLHDQTIEHRRLSFEELNYQEEIDAMELAFDEDFTGDRVFALMTGLTGMIRHSYDYKEEMFFTDRIDPNKLYTSARNVEIMAWRLKMEKQTNGRPFLITSFYNGKIDNTSFERLYGKMIGQQDILAKVIADRDSRSINFFVHSGASMVFLPF